MRRTLGSARSLAHCVVLGIAFLVAEACASTPPASDTSAARPVRPARRSNVLITREELTESTARDALQAVRMLRPDWLRGRGPTSLGGGVPEVLVYLDGQRMGGVNTLAQFPAIGIKELRFHSATDATQRWGTDHSGGVVEVITR